MGWRQNVILDPWPQIDTVGVETGRYSRPVATDRHSGGGYRTLSVATDRHSGGGDRTLSWTRGHRYTVGVETGRYPRPVATDRHSGGGDRMLS